VTIAQTAPSVPSHEPRLCHKIRREKREKHARRLSQTDNHKPRSQVPLTGGLLVHTKSVAIVGYGAVGRYLHRLFPEAVVYDEPLGMGDREEVNRSQFAFVAVPTNGRPDGSGDPSIVDATVSWLTT